MTDRKHSRWLSAAVGALAIAGCATGAVAKAGTPDRPETGLQGQQSPADNPGSILPTPYSKGVNVVGHEPILSRDSNVQLVWAGHCAYVSSTAGPFPVIGTIKGDPALGGVAVIDVSDPAHPKLVKRLRDKGSIAALETISAVTAPDGRMVLAAGAYHGGANTAGTSGGVEHDPAGGAAWLSIYDLSDCANPKLMAEVAWPENSHSVSLSPDGRFVYGTAMSPFTGSGGLQVMDISDMAKPRFVGKFGATRPDGSTFDFASHEIRFSADGRRIYAGVNASKSDDLNKGIKIFPPNPRALGPQGGGVFILDNSDFVDAKADPKLRLISAVPAGGWHTVMPARIGGVPFLVGGAELGSCPGTWPKITDIADETRPKIVGEFRLAMNKPENCPPGTPGPDDMRSVVPSAGTATLHYNDVDSATDTDTRLGLFNFMWAGLRIADLRKPEAPVEVAYFKPGDVCTGHVRYIGNRIWLTCLASGFWVLELKPELRRKLGLPNRR